MPSCTELRIRAAAALAAALLSAQQNTVTLEHHLHHVHAAVDAHCDGCFLDVSEVLLQLLEFLVYVVPKGVRDFQVPALYMNQHYRAELLSRTLFVEPPKSIIPRRALSIERAGSKSSLFPSTIF